MRQRFQLDLTVRFGRLHQLCSELPHVYDMRHCLLLLYCVLQQLHGLHFDHTWTRLQHGHSFHLGLHHGRLQQLCAKLGILCEL